MSSIETGDESLSPEAFASEVYATMFSDETETPTVDTAEAPAETGDTSTADTADTGDAAREVTEDATGRLHGPDGKFVDKTEEGDEAETAPEADTETVEPEFVIEVDDEETAEKVQKLLEKYDGDISKTLAAAVEAQSLIGRKGSEATQAAAEAAALRTELAEQRKLLETVAERTTKPQVPLVPITRELIDEDPAQAAQQAVLQENSQALEAAIAVWREENAEAAELFLQNLILRAELEQERSAPAAATEEVVVTPDAAIDEEVAKVLVKHPDLEKYLPAIAEAAKAHPLLQRALEQGEPKERAQALEALTVIAKAGAGADTSREALTKVQVRVKQEADDARRTAKVVSASRSSAATGDQPTGVDLFLSEFDKRLGLDIETA